MPYSMVFTFQDGDVRELKPLQPDSLNNIYGLEDRRILRKAENIARWINRTDKECEVSVKHYSL